MAQPRNVLVPDRLDRAIGWAALLLLAATLAALARGQAEWHRIPAAVWWHLATICIALALTPANLWLRRGNTRHRVLGYVWVLSLALTAAISFAIHGINRGGLSLIHFLSGWTLLMLPGIVLTARRGDHLGHREAVRRMAIGALLIAGFFTFPFGRMLGRWLFA